MKPSQFQCNGRVRPGVLLLILCSVGAVFLWFRPTQPSRVPALEVELGRSKTEAARHVNPIEPQPSLTSTGGAGRMDYRTAAAPPLSRSGHLYSIMTNPAAVVRLTAEQLDQFLHESGRSPSSLLAAYRASRDPAFLEEAMRDHPLDPKVGFEASMRTDVSTTERRQWLDRFKQGSPDNALADYLSASEHFKAGRVEDALQDLAAASGKRKFQDYTLERIQDGEEALRSAGYPAAEANLLANHQMQLPQLVEARQLAGTLVDLAGSYRQAGDETSRQSVLSMALDLGRRFGEAQPGNLTIAQLVGFQIETQALGAMDPAAASGSGGLTVQNRIQQLGQQREAMLDLARQTNPLWAGLSEQDWITYQKRSSTFGEDAAKQWLVKKFGAK